MNVSSSEIQDTLAVILWCVDSETLVDLADRYSAF
jgi:hypothetical protein